MGCTIRAQALATRVESTSPSGVNGGGLFLFFYFFFPPAWMTAGGALAIAARLAQRGCARATTVAKWVRWCDLGAGIVPEAVDASGASETGAVSCQDDCLGCCALRSGTVCLARPACDPRGSRVACLFRATNPFGGLEGNRRANASPEVGLALCPCSLPCRSPPDSLRSPAVWRQPLLRFSMARLWSWH